jgi:hypothetical protein
MSQINQIFQRFQLELTQLHHEYLQEIKDNSDLNLINQVEFDQAKKIFEQEITNLTNGFVNKIVETIYINN